MDADGGKSKYPSNKIGAKYGAGYCDSQCPRDLKWIGGKVCCFFPNSFYQSPTQAPPKWKVSLIPSGLIGQCGSGSCRGWELP